MVVVSAGPCSSLGPLPQRGSILLGFRLGWEGQDQAGFGAFVLRVNRPRMELSGGAGLRCAPTSPAHKAGHKAGLILVQIRCAKPCSDNSPFLKATSGDCGKYVALIDC